MIQFNIMGIIVQIKFLFIAIITIFLLTDTTGLGIICLLSCMLHELGHIISFYIVKLKPRLLCFDITGIKLEQPKQQLPFLTELIILSSGCLTNFTIAIILNFIGANINIILINIVIGTFNLLPIHTFDGGKILFATLSCFVSDKVAYKISIIIEKTTIILLISLCLFSIFAYELNLSLIIITILLIISLILKSNC